MGCFGTPLAACGKDKLWCPVVLVSGQMALEHKSSSLTWGAYLTYLHWLRITFFSQLVVKLAGKTKTNRSNASKSVMLVFELSSVVQCCWHIQILGGFAPFDTKIKLIFQFGWFWFIYCLFAYFHMIHASCESAWLYELPVFVSCFGDLIDQCTPLPFRTRVRSWRTPCSS